MRAEHRNVLLKSRMDRRSQARQPLLLNTRAQREAAHATLLTELETKRRAMLLYIEQMRAA